jgi:hypothetical protein
MSIDPKRLQEIVEARKSGLTYAQIAERLGTSRQNIHALYGRSKKTMKPKAPKHSFTGWLEQAEPGDQIFVEIKDKSVVTSALRVGCKVHTERWIAIHPGTKRVRDLVRVEFICREHRTLIGEEIF